MDYELFLFTEYYLSNHQNTEFLWSRKVEYAMQLACYTEKEEGNSKCLWETVSGPANPIQMAPYLIPSIYCHRRQQTTTTSTVKLSRIGKIWWRKWPWREITDAKCTSFIAWAWFVIDNIDSVTGNTISNCCINRMWWPLAFTLACFKEDGIFSVKKDWIFRTKAENIPESKNDLIPFLQMIFPDAESILTTTIHA